MADEKKPRRTRKKKDQATEPQEVEATEAADASAEPETEADAAPEPEAGASAEAEPDEPSAGADEEPEAEAADEPSADAPDEESAEPAAEAEADEAAEEPEAKPRRGRRRGAVETSTPKKKDEPARPAPRDKDGAIAVRAQAKYVRRAPRKARLVMDHIRGKDVSQARAILRHTPRAAAEDILKLLNSAVANAENNFELDPEELRIGRAVVDEGPTLKRYRPRALGRATPIHKRTSHMTITLTTTGDDR